MFGIFKKKKEQVLLDLDGNPLNEGDIVQNYRYEMGECRLVKTAAGFVYDSLADGRQVSWVRMIDAATERQKVKLK
jgi:hypothetical protein